MAGLFSLLSGGTVQAQWKVDFAPEYFNWWEYINGRQVVHESGFRYGVEASYQQPCDQGWLWTARGKLYAGSVDYHGETFDGVPTNHTTEYYGGLAELNYVYRRRLGETQYLDVMSGIGIENWYRRPVEDWMPIYLQAGLKLSPRKTGWSGLVGIKMPVLTIEWAAGMSGDGTFILYPSPRPSGFGEIGYAFAKGISVAIFFDSYRFAKSSRERATYNSYYQPESTMNRSGVKVGWAF